MQSQSIRSQVLEQVKFDKIMQRLRRIKLFDSDTPKTNKAREAEKVPAISLTP